MSNLVLIMKKLYQALLVYLIVNGSIANLYAIHKRECIPSNGGTISVKAGNPSYLTAVPNEGFRFAYWEHKSSVTNYFYWTKTQNPITLTVDEYNSDYGLYIAYFEKITYTITTSATSGSIRGGGSYNYGATATLTAIPDGCHHFSQWSDGNTDNPRTITVTGNATYTAEFDYTGIGPLASGTCGVDGDNLTWELGCDSVLTISGTGAMRDYTLYSAPWYSNRNTITSVIINDSVTSIGDRAFYNSIGLTSVTIPNSLTSIGYRAFYGCNGLASVEFPSSVTSIGKSAFNLCTSLTSVTIPNTITYIGAWAFEACSNLTAINVASDNPNYCSQDGVLFNKDKTIIRQYPGGLQGAYLVPNGVTKIDTSAFSYCDKLSSIEIPTSVTSIGYRAFYGCNGLASVEFPSSVTSIGKSAFNLCTSLTSVTIPNTITYIGAWAFEACSNLTAINVASDNPNYCSQDGVLFNKDKTIIRQYPGGLQGAYLVPNGVTKIDTSAFSYCDKLSSIEIPNSVTDIGYRAFYGCSGLSYIICEATIPPTLGGNHVFTDVDKTIPLYVPEGSVDLYMAADQWNEFNILPRPTYTITWQYDNGSLIDQTACLFGEIPTHVDPTKPANAQYTYTFKGWDPAVVSVTGDATYTAQFDSTLIEYHIDTNPGGEPIEGGDVHIDGTPTYGETIILTPVEEEGYEFDHWSDGNTDNPRSIVVTGDSAIYPVFVKKQYLILFINYNGSVLQSDNVEHGVTPVYNEATPIKPATAQYTYTFKEWSPAIVAATAPATYTAQYDSAKVVYDVDVTVPDPEDNHGTVTIDGEKTYGETITIIVTPEDGYVFEQWSDGDTHNPREIVVEGDITIYPIFHKCEEKTSLTEIVIGKGESYEFGGKIYTARGIYYDTITLANGCDSISILKLSVTKKKTFNLRVSVDSTQLACGTATGSGIYNDGQTVTIEAIPSSSKYVFARWWNPDEGIEIFENPYTFALTRNLTLKAVFKRAKKNNVIVKAKRVHVVDTDDSTYRIYDSAGRLLITSKEENIYTLPSGLYFIQVDDQTEKFIIQ